MNHPNVFQDIIDFHKAMCPDQINEKPSVPSIGIQRLRKNLIEEESSEMLDAMRWFEEVSMLSYITEEDIRGHLAAIADGAIDSIVVILGTLVAYGIDFNACWNEVHKTNMAKQGGPVRPDGKRLKPEDWVPPDIKGILARQESILK